MKDDMGLYGEFVKRLGEDNIKEPDYDLVDALVMKYQGGDKEAAEELIRQMAPYLAKFFKIIRLGVIDLSDRDSRRFIALFIDNAVARAKLKKAFQSSDARNEAFQAALMVQSMCSSIPSEDIIQELIVILLTLASRYIKRRSKVNFCGYLYNAFRFELGRRIKNMTIDPITHRYDFNLSFSDGDCITEEDVMEESIIQSYVNEPMMVLDEELGNSWIRGITCGDEFSCLTQLQRIILKMYYIDGEYDLAIADRLGMHRNTIKAQRVLAEKKLKEAKGDLHGKKED